MGSIYQKPKFWILVISITFFVIEFIRNFVGNIMPWKINFALSII